MKLNALTISGLVLVAGIATLSSCNCEQEPKTYDDCILKYLKPNAEPFAALQIMEACKSKFKKKTHD